jgi:hypothetical protein
LNGLRQGRIVTQSELELIRRVSVAFRLQQLIPAA